MSAEESDNECYICYSANDEKSITLDCGHELHVECVKSAFDSTHMPQRCPVCRDKTSYYTIRSVGSEPRMEKNRVKAAVEIFTGQFKLGAAIHALGYFTSNLCFNVALIGGIAVVTMARGPEEYKKWFFIGAGFSCLMGVADVIIHND